MEFGFSESFFAQIYCYNATDTDQDSATSLKQRVDSFIWINFIQVSFLILNENCQDARFLLEIVLKSFVD